MSTITTIQSSDLISDSRATINTNFSNLNTDKIEAATTVALTNKTIAGGSNTISGITETMLSTSDITTLDVSTSKHGFVPKAPNDTTKFLRGDATWQVPSGGSSATIKTFTPTPPLPVDDVIASFTNDSDTTTARFYRFVLPYTIVVNNISMAAVFNSSAGTFDVGIYSEDGQTKHIDVTTGSITTNAVVQASVSAVSLAPGAYYIAVVRNSGDNGLLCQNFLNNAWDFLNGYDLTSKPKMSGTATVTSGTLPSTFDPVSGLTEISTAAAWLWFRLDN